LPTSSVHLFAPPPQQQYITSTVGTLPLQMTSTAHLSMSTPLPGSQPLPSQLLGARTSALGRMFLHLIIIYINLREIVCNF
jgi:hypothetical protein